MKVGFILENSFMNWLAIKNYEGLYEVSNTGLVRSIARDKTLALNPHKDTKYLVVSLWKNNKGKNFYVHRLVCEAFIPNPNELPEVNHIDGNRQNNHTNNLEWVDRQGNIKHAIETGLRTYTSRLTNKEFLELLKLVINGKTYQELSQEVNYQVPYLSTKLRKIARDNNLEGQLDNALSKQKQERLSKHNQTQSRLSVACYDKTGQLIKSYNSLGDASRDLNVSTGAISNAISGRTKSCRGFTWKSI